MIIESKGEALRILYVEDDEDTRDVLSALLAMSGYQVEAAGTVAEGLHLAEGGGFALVILDSWLKEGSGIELCQKIRTFDRHTPVLFLSGSDSQTEMEMAMDAGAQGYIIKPCEIEDVEQAIRSLVHTKKPGG
jgi:two-component system response regulator QseB